MSDLQRPALTALLERCRRGEMPADEVRAAFAAEGWQAADIEALLARPPADAGREHIRRTRYGIPQQGKRGNV